MRYLLPQQCVHVALKTCAAQHLMLQVRGAPGSKYGTQVDLWACGVVLYILLSGQPPFFHQDMRALYRFILKGSFAFQDPIWDAVSEPCEPSLGAVLTSVLCACATVKWPAAFPLCLLQLTSRLL
jgi:serine/threonine protein kinase